MAEIDIPLTSSAAREFERLNREVQHRFTDAIELLRTDPDQARPGFDIRPMKGLKGMGRWRVGEYRGIY